MIPGMHIDIYRMIAYPFITVVGNKLHVNVNFKVFFRVLFLYSIWVLEGPYDTPMTELSSMNCKIIQYLGATHLTFDSELTNLLRIRKTEFQIIILHGGLCIKVSIANQNKIQQFSLFTKILCTFINSN